MTLVDLDPGSGWRGITGEHSGDRAAGECCANPGGILQAALNGNISGGPTVTLVAGTLPTVANGNKGYPGDIDLGDSGVIGGTINLSANGNINGLIMTSRQNSIVNAAQNFTGTVLSGGSASVSATAGSVSGDRGGGRRQCFRRLGRDRPSARPECVRQRRSHHLDPGYFRGGTSRQRFRRRNREYLKQGSDPDDRHEYRATGGQSEEEETPLAGPDGWTRHGDFA